ncbi:hypothetical protein GGI42DRAFT_327333 [Trichoderma sp. SZMC 28013]
MPLDSHSNPDSVPWLQFSRFKELPTEARVKIWRAAVHEATVGRTIHVEVHTQLQVTLHSCFASTKIFCGLHGSCPSFRYGNGLGNWPSDCMADGYFAATDKVSSPEDSYSASEITSLSLACRESRAVVLELYSKALRVYQGSWHQGVKSRLVRCRPETDVLVIYAVPDLSLCHQVLEGLTTEHYWQLQKEAMMKRFPCSDRQFTTFKEITSCFQNVAIFTRMGRELETQRQHLPEIDVDEIAGNDLVHSTDLRALIYFFTSLKQLYLWLDPACWPDVWENAIRVDDVADLQTARNAGTAHNASRALQNRWFAARHIQDESRDFLQSYNAGVEVQNNHFAIESEHWVPRAKPLERIGCYYPISWLQ